MPACRLHLDHPLHSIKPLGENADRHVACYFGFTVQYVFGYRRPRPRHQHHGPSTYKVRTYLACWPGGGGSFCARHSRRRLSRAKRGSFSCCGYCSMDIVGTVGTVSTVILCSPRFCQRSLIRSRITTLLRFQCEIHHTRRPS